MNQSFVKMMNRVAEVENHILKGLVLGEHGNWVPIADRKAVEEDFLAHISAGQVLYQGRWVTFAEVKNSRTKEVERPPHISMVSPRRAPKRMVIVETPVAAPADTAIIVQAPAPEEDTRIVQMPPPPQSEKRQETEEVLPETKVMVQALSPEEETRFGQAPPPPQSGKPQEPEEAPPETKVIVQALSPEEDTRIAQAPPPYPEITENNEEYAPETKVIYIRPQQQAAAPGTEPKAVNDGDTRIFSQPAISSWEKSGHDRKRRILLAGGIIVTLAGIAAILVLLKALWHF
jgi:hypothetical protein